MDVGPKLPGIRIDGAVLEDFPREEYENFLVTYGHRLSRYANISEDGNVDMWCTLLEGCVDL